MESLIKHLKHPQVVLHYLREKPIVLQKRRKANLVFNGDGTARPYRVKIKSPDYASLQAIDTLGRGHYIADVVAIIGSLDVVFEVSIDNSVVFLCGPLNINGKANGWTFAMLKPLITVQGSFQAVQNKNQSITHGYVS
jgi:hypothetical protein